MWRWMIVVLFSMPAVMVAPFSPAAPAGEVPLTVEEPSGVARTQWPVTSGIPFARGALLDDRATALFDAAGNEIPVQTEPLARWPDGSVRWLLLDFQLDLAANEKKSVTLRYGSAVRRAAIEKPIRVTRQPDGKVTIEPGPVRLEYDPKRFFPQGEAWLTAGTNGRQADRRLTINCGADGVILQDGEKRSYFPAAHPAEVTIEQSGPVRACIRVEGWHNSPSAETGDSKMFRYVARIHAWRGQPWIRVFYTFINDRQDSLMTNVRKLELRFWVRGVGGLDDNLLGGQSVREGRLFQVDEN
ncbi:MAG: hypothetical protein HQ581_14950, partial [Planctomycetes bacterium]|nr:hypothetical protein [Planctomycetota bacterium]